MASANNEVNLNNLDVVDLDYNSIKQSLKNFLKGQSQFKDYNFDGPNMATLLRLLAYNSYINAFYTNMALSEGHLDSAQLRASILSHAKDLNYLPRSSRSSQARISCTFEATGASGPYTIEKGSTFSAVVKNTSYVFSVPETLTVASSNTTYTFETDIYEGFYVQDSYVVEGLDNERFRITNKNVDTSSITVTVFENGSTIGDIYNYKQTLLDVDALSKVYFLQSVDDGYYELLFGDNILGKKPSTGATVVIDYRLSNGPVADGATRFGIDFDPTGSDELTSTPVVETLQSSYNGADAETNESVRYYAPRAFQVQERTVVDNDYSVALKTQFPEINVVYAYGGEEANPPRMGKVFISVDISNVDGLPDSKIREYTEFLRERSPFGIDPIFIEPEELFIFLRSTVRYDVTVTANSPERIKTLVTNAITTYNEKYLDDFNATFRDSAMSRAIDFADPSIVSSITDVRMYKKLVPEYEVARNYIVDFDVPIVQFGDAEASSAHSVGVEHAVTSDTFMYRGINVFMEDDGVGNMRLIQRRNNLDVEVARIGTVDYATGEINLTNLNIQSFSGTDLRIFAYPADKDITSSKNTILKIEQNGMQIDVEQLRIVD